MGSAEMSAQVVINEIMQSNVDCITDDLNEFPDSWVELYNAGTESVNLSKYRLGLTSEANGAWQLPDKELAAGGYAIVYCDKEATGMHTDYRLESGKGGEIYLFCDGNLIDNLTGLKKQPAPNIAYGRKTDNADKWGYMAKPTPGEANCGETCKEILGDPLFSVKGQVMASNRTLSLSLTMPEGTPEGTEIRYTTDGTEPTADSQLYTTEIGISTTTTVRAKMFCKGYLTPRSVTHSYIYHGRDVTLPVVSIVTNEKYFYDDKFGIYIDGSYKQDEKNYNNNWRRPMNIEFFEGAESESVINQLGETRVSGGATRELKLKSLAVYANKRFGTKRLNYEFFPDQRPGVTDYKSILMRNAGNDFDYLFMRDAIMQRSVAQNADLDWQAWRPVIFYLNGKYMGMLNIRERSNEDNIYTNYDGLEDIDMVENWYELKTGDMENFYAFKEFYNSHDHTLDEYRKWMDIEEYANLMVMNIFYNNRDFPGNNFVMWRPKTEDGVWRFVAKDTDFGLGLYGVKADYKTLNWINNHDYDPGTAWANDYEHTRLFRRLMEIEEFRQIFFDRAAIYMGDFLNSARVREIWDEMYQTIKFEYKYHRQGINPWWPNYDDELASARTFLANRPGCFYTHMAEYYNLGTPRTMTVNMSVDNACEMETSINGIKLTRGTFNGKYFQGMHVTIECDKAAGWDIKTFTNAETETKTVKGSRYEFNMPECKSIVINAIPGSDPVDEIEADEIILRTTPEGISVSGVEEGQNIELYDMRGMLIYKGIANGQETNIRAVGRQMYILKTGKKAIKISKK